MIRVVAALIESQGRLLICQRRRGGAFALKWEFPGGKMLASETPWEALARELREELAVDAHIGREVYCARHRYAEMGDRVEVTFLAATLFTSALPARHAVTRVFERIVWARRADLRRYDFLAADRILVARLAAGDFPAPFERPPRSHHSR
ncbi:MAG TPA: NUDIX domain-containing protein [Candidatus Acidoferrales bacterium]